jgi:hypothetical protein
MHQKPECLLCYVSSCVSVFVRVCIRAWVCTHAAQRTAFVHECTKLQVFLCKEHTPSSTFTWTHWNTSTVVLCVSVRTQTAWFRKSRWTHVTLCLCARCVVFVCAHIPTHTELHIDVNVPKRRRRLQAKDTLQRDTAHTKYHKCDWFHVHIYGWHLDDAEERESVCVTVCVYI